MHVVISKFVIANDFVSEIKDAFRNRPGLVDDTPGFVKLDVISPIDKPEEIQLITYWDDEESYIVWHKGHTYKEAHKGIPKGVKLVPRETEIRAFEHITS